MRRQISEDGHATSVDDRYTVDVLYGPTRVCGLVKHRLGRVTHVKGEYLNGVGLSRYIIIIIIIIAARLSGGSFYTRCRRTILIRANADGRCRKDVRNILF